MKLFEMKNWQLTVSEEAWGLLPFKKILDRDKTKDKSIANKEILFVFYYCDIRSIYLDMEPEEVKISEIKKDINLSKDWEIDTVMKDAIDLYNKSNQSIIQKLYKQAIKSASDIGDYLENTAELLEERDNHGKPIVDISKITTALGRIPKLMGDLNAAYKEVVKEQEELGGQKKGSKKFNTFENGFEL